MCQAKRKKEKEERGKKEGETGCELLRGEGDSAFLITWGGEGRRRKGPFRLSDLAISNI